jgi:hypothetical protein
MADKNIDTLDETLKALSIKDEKKVSFKDILYYSIVVSEESFNSIKTNPDIIKHAENLDKDIKLNEKLHITALYTGGKFHENACKFQDFIGKDITINVDTFAISSNFIVLGVTNFSYVKDDINEDENISDKVLDNVPYYGNPIKHITYGVKKGCKPVNSPTAFKDGVTHTFEKQLKLNAKLEVVTK